MNPLLSWFARHRVAANLLMLLILFGGFLQLKQVPKKVFPEFSADQIAITVEYPGAAPEDVEEAICARIEDRLQGLENIDRLRSAAEDGLGTVWIDWLPGTDMARALEDVKARVDAIDTFPEDAEPPRVEELILRRQVLSLVLSGPADALTLRKLARTLRDGLVALPGVSQAELVASRPYEMAIEVPPSALRRHDLSLQQIAETVRQSSVDLPGGLVKAGEGEVRLQTRGRARTARQFEEIILLIDEDGTRIRLGDLATVRDGLAENDFELHFDGQPAVMIDVLRIGDQQVTDIASEVRSYLEAVRPDLPEELRVTVWQDDTRLLEGRLQTLLSNGRDGMILVLLVLALFLRWRLALWVALGIPLSIFGAVALMPVFGISIHLVALFGFIIVLGLVVDDATVVGEHIHHLRERGRSGIEAAVQGVQEVAGPVVFAVLTTMVAFAPLLAVPGTAGQVMRDIPRIVMLTLVFSLVESLLILPAHLSHLPAGGRRSRFERWQRRLNARVLKAVRRIYRPLLRRALAWRYTTVAAALGLLFLSVGLIASGRVPFSFLPPVEAETIAAFVRMPIGTPAPATAEILGRLEASALEVEADWMAAGGGPILQHRLRSLGAQPFRNKESQTPSPHPGVSTAHFGELALELVDAEERTLSASEFSRRWREKLGPLPETEELMFSTAAFSAGQAIHVQLSGEDLDALRQAATEVRQSLASFPPVFDIRDTFRSGKQEMRLALTPSGEALGLRLADLARQVRAAFHGVEVQRLQRGTEESRVMVRYPALERRSLRALEEMWVQVPGGDQASGQEEVPLITAARLEPGRGLARIERIDQRRTISVLADVDRTEGNSLQILRALETQILPEILHAYPGVSYSLEGEQAEQRQSVDGLRRGFFFALFLIYALLALPFRSYAKPLIVMSAIPFGMIGAVGGHALLGRDLTIFSLFGIVALAGVVVNDSLILLDFVRRRREAGATVRQAILRAGERRFRPILLTSVTTFAGLTPLLFERSLQAQFLIPMAISVAFGVLFATLIVLVLVPIFYQVLEDLLKIFSGTRIS